MREIKFKFFNKESECMSSVYTLEELSSGKYDFHGDVKDCEKLQYTGLKDKNGVEIYEGDIVNVSKKFPEQYEIIYQDISFRFKATKNNHFVKEGSVWSLSLDFEFEVIGNIYENPTLLNP